jgi:uncharacterized protein (DUF433 family)
MADVVSTHPAVVRTERGLSIAGTRITLYDVMDYLSAGWPAKLIRDRLNLTEEQIRDVMDYISIHRDEVEAEYRSVLQAAQESREYWDERNRERLAQIAALPPKPGQEAIREKLRAWRERLGSTES